MTSDEVRSEVTDAGLLFFILTRPDFHISGFAEEINYRNDYIAFTRMSRCINVVIVSMRNTDII